MSIQKILTSDTLGAAIRSKYNETVDEIISNNGIVENDGLIKLPKYGGGFYTIDLRNVFYTKSQVNDITPTPLATEVTYGKVKRATIDDVVNGLDETRFVSPAKLQYKLDDYFSKAESIGSISDGLDVGNNAGINNYFGTHNFFNLAGTYKGTLNLENLTQNVVARMPDVASFTFATKEELTGYWKVGGNLTDEVSSFGANTDVDTILVWGGGEVARVKQLTFSFPQMPTVSSGITEFGIFAGDTDLKKVSLANATTAIAAQMGQDTFWRVGGNTVSAVTNIGTANNFNWNAIVNNATVAVFQPTGISLPTISTLGSVVSNFAVIGASNLIQQRSIANVRTDLYGTGTTNYLTKRNASNQLVDSRIFDNGNIGINTNNPEQIFHIVSASNAWQILERNSTSNISFLQFRTGLVADVGIGVINSSGDFSIFTYGNSSSAITVLKSNGNVGIKKNPEFALDVNGTIATTGFRYTTGAVTGYILQTDASGNASWVSPSTLASTYRGTWDASTNTPSLANGTGTTGNWYRCVVAGTVNFGAGNISFAVGDDVYYNGSIWQRIPFSYTLVTASSSTLGGIRIGSTLAIDGSGIANLNTVTQGSGSSFVKVTIDAYGRVTGNSVVVAADIPDLSNSYVNLSTTQTIFGDKTFRGSTSFRNVDGFGLTITQGQFQQNFTANGSITMRPEVAFNVTIDSVGVIGATQSAINLFQNTAITGNLSYTGLLTANNSTGTNGQVLMRGASNNAWTTLVASNISDLSGLLNAKENTITAGTTAQYWRGDKTWQTLNTAAVAESTNLYFTDARVRSVVLTGYTVGSNTALAATDTVLAAFGKVQGQINNKENTITVGTTAQYWRGDKTWRNYNTDWDARWNTIKATNVSFGGNVVATGDIVGNSITANVGSFTNSLVVNGQLFDSLNYEGALGQFLRSDGAGVRWVDLDADLTTIAGLTHVNKNVIISDGTNWTSRGLAISDVTNLQSSLDGKMPFFYETLSQNGYVENRLILPFSFEADDKVPFKIGISKQFGSFFIDYNKLLPNNSTQRIRNYIDEETGRWYFVDSETTLPKRYILEGESSATLNAVLASNNRTSNNIQFNYDSTTILGSNNSKGLEFISNTGINMGYIGSGQATRFDTFNNLLILSRVGNTIVRAISGDVELGTRDANNYVMINGVRFNMNLPSEPNDGQEIKMYYNKSKQSITIRAV